MDESLIGQANRVPDAHSASLTMHNFEQAIPTPSRATRNIGASTSAIRQCRGLNYPTTGLPPPRARVASIRHFAATTGAFTNHCRLRETHGRPSEVTGHVQA